MIKGCKQQVAPLFVSDRVVGFTPFIDHSSEKSYVNHVFSSGHAFTEGSSYKLKLIASDGVGQTLRQCGGMTSSTERDILGAHRKGSTP